MILLLLLAAVVRGPGDPESMARAADAVVRAQVRQMKSALVGGQIFTTVVLDPVETWKGSVEPRISILVAGGAVGDLAQDVQGMARFTDGEEVVVFLSRRTGGVYSVANLALGKFSVARRAVRDRRGLECAGCGAGESDDFSVDELRERVLRAR